jgi:hypothetical protein
MFLFPGFWFRVFHLKHVRAASAAIRSLPAIFPLTTDYGPRTTDYWLLILFPSTNRKSVAFLFTRGGYFACLHRPTHCFHCTRPPTKIRKKFSWSIQRFGV